MNIAEIIGQIREMGEEDLQLLLPEVMKRFDRLVPGWELSYIALPKNDKAERKRYLDHAVKYLLEGYTLPAEK